MNTWQQSPVQVNMDLSYIDPTEVTPGFGIHKVRVNARISSENTIQTIVVKTVLTFEKSPFLQFGTIQWGKLPKIDLCLCQRQRQNNSFFIHTTPGSTPRDVAWDPHLPLSLGCAELTIFSCNTPSASSFFAPTWVCNRRDSFSLRGHL